MDYNLFTKINIDKTCDKDFYIKAYKDLRGREMDAKTHYNTHGRTENRLPNLSKFTSLYPDFDLQTYLLNNLDLKGFTNEELMAHYHHHGRFESRSYKKEDSQLESAVKTSTQLVDSNTKTKKSDHSNQNEQTLNETQSRQKINPFAQKLAQTNQKLAQTNQRLGQTVRKIGPPLSQKINQPSRKMGPPSQKINQPNQKINQPSRKMGPPSQKLGQTNQKFGQSRKYIDHANLDKVLTINQIQENPLSLDAQLDQLIDLKSQTKQIYLVMANWGYPPFGGGECWLIDTMKWMSEVDYECYYIYFNDHRTNSQFEKINVISFDFGHFIQFDQNEVSLIKFIQLLSPCVISHQGANRMKYLRVANLLQIPFVTGFCFWQDIIKMQEKSGQIFNKDMENKQLIPDENFLLVHANCAHLYAVGQFVNVIVKKVHDIDIDVINTISDQSHYLVDTMEQNIYVTVINICGLKGGLILNQIIKNTNINIPFILIDSQNGHDTTNQTLEKLIKERNLQETGHRSMYIKGMSDIKPIYKKTKILLIPSLVDETFCRVGYEGMMNEIPILSTKNGNLKYLLDGYADFLDAEPHQWSNKINSIYDDDAYLNQMKSRKKPIIMDDDKFKFVNLIQRFSSGSYGKYLNEKSVGFYCPWADQGLGIQCREYYHLLKTLGYHVSVFSFLPYHANQTNPKLQTDPKEWDFENIYYTNHTRELVSVNELLDYIHQYKIKKMIIVETCFNKIFEFAEICQLLQIDVYAIPNLETIRYSELHKHNIFTKILCNNQMTYEIMNFYFPKKTHLLDFRILNQNFTDDKTLPMHHFSFFCVGGLNSLTRKNVAKILSAFKEIENERKLKNFKLYVYIQGVEIPPNINKFKSSNILIRVGARSYAQIAELYKKHDIFIHMGDHEGLGLGFYESIACGTPVLTIDTPPNNEIIKEGLNGWLVSCHFDKLTDNNQAISKKATITVRSIKDKLLQIISSYDRKTWQQCTHKDYLNRFPIDSYYTNWKRILNE